MGGSMMGQALPHDDLPVIKATNCVVAASALDLQPRAAEMPCIRCGNCSEVCPAMLLPQQLHWYAAGRAISTRSKRYGLIDCIECGCCDYVCPSQIPLAERFRDAKPALIETARRARERRRGARALRGARRRASSGSRASGARSSRRSARSLRRNRRDAHRCHSPPHRLRTSSHRTASARVMRLVLYALVPTVALHVVFFGPGLLIQIVLGVATALAAEAAALRLRGKPLPPLPARRQRNHHRRAARAVPAAARAVVAHRQRRRLRDPAREASVRRTRRESVQSGDGRLRRAARLVSGAAAAMAAAERRRARARVAVVRARRSRRFSPARRRRASPGTRSRRRRRSTRCAPISRWA